MTSAAARPGRRRVLTGMLGSAALVLTAPALAACTGAPTPPPGPDPLEPLAVEAEADVALAEAVAAAHPDLSGPATALLADRREHAAALRAELRRVRPTTASAPSGAPSTSAPAPPPVPPGRAAARDALASAITSAQESAATLVPGLPGYRAALLASIAACCASHRAVLT